MCSFAKHSAVALFCGVLSACASAQGDLSVASLRIDLPSTPGTIGAAAETHGLGKPAKPPSGFVDFCTRNATECRAPNNAPSEVTFTPQLLATLQEVNITVNKTIQPLDDSVHYGVAEFWTVPSDGYGDCEDYVLAKRKMLTLLGLPQPALRIAVVVTRRRVRHAVLMIVTDQGDYVLDNLRDDILPQSKIDYTWVERQDRASSTGWTSLKLVANQ
jgi:predicted transglutaminase-like cysteine proteinase